MSFMHHPVISQLTLSMAEKSVLNALANFADKQGKCWPSQTTLAKSAGCSVSTIKRNLARLKSRGLVDWIQVDYFTCKYQLRLPTKQQLMSHPLVHSELPPSSLCAAPSLTLTYKPIKEPTKEQIKPSVAKTATQNSQQEKGQNPMKIPEGMKGSEIVSFLKDKKAKDSAAKPAKAPTVHALYGLWKDLLVDVHGKPYVGGWTLKEMGMAKHFMKAIPEPMKAMDCVLRDWVCYALYVKGECSLKLIPSEPNLSFLVKYCDEAMAYMLKKTKVAPVKQGGVKILVKSMSKPVVQVPPKIEVEQDPEPFPEDLPESLKANWLEKPTLEDLLELEKYLGLT